VKIKLLKFEQTAMMTENSISKVSFFAGESAEVYSDVRQRMIRLIELNPWLASRVIKDKSSKEVMLEFDENASPEDLVDSLLFVDKNLRIDDSMDYHQ
jgi:hypothetical protein